MSDPVTQLKDVLRENGCSLTTPRKAVFAALQHQEPQTMRELTAAVGGKVDRASVYRTVALFESFGIVQRLQIGWKYKLELSDQFSDHHHHLSCVRCGRTIALQEDTVLEMRIKTLARAQGFQAIDHQFEVRGLCQACQAAAQ